MIDQGVDGFYVMGSTGECFLLDEQERMDALKLVVSAVRGRATVVAHIGSVSTRQAVRLAGHAALVGADAISSVPPFYYKYSFDGILSHYRTIVDAVPLPMIIYNFPALSGVTFTMDQLRQFAEDPRIVGVKHTSMDLFQLERIHTLIPRFALFSGHDEVFLAGLAMGAQGAIGSTFNIMAPKFLRILRLFRANRIAEAQAEQNSANQVIAALVEAGVFPGIKYFLDKRGLICHGCRTPMSNLTADQQRLLDTVEHLLAPLADD